MWTLPDEASIAWPDWPQRRAVTRACPPRSNATASPRKRPMGIVRSGSFPAPTVAYGSAARNPATRTSCKCVTCAGPVFQKKTPANRLICNANRFANRREICKLPLAVSTFTRTGWPSIDAVTPPGTGRPIHAEAGAAGKRGVTNGPRSATKDSDNGPGGTHHRAYEPQRSPARPTVHPTDAMYREPCGIQAAGTGRPVNADRSSCSSHVSAVCPNRLIVPEMLRTNILSARNQTSSLAPEALVVTTSPPSRAHVTVSRFPIESCPMSPTYDAAARSRGEDAPTRKPSQRPGRCTR